MVSTARTLSVEPTADVSVRLQQRRQYEKAKEAKEIYDLQAEINADQITLLGIANRAMAYNQAEMIKAKQANLDELRARYISKYGENP
jgi:hypothetical protein